jgi:hypothetical protein
MSGFLSLSADPTSALHASTKQYVDSLISGGALIPSGTRMIFDQGSAPTGWTRDISTVNDRVIRIVTGSRVDGGTWTQPGHTHQAPAHNHAQGFDTESGSHSHNVNSHLHTTSAAPSIQEGTGGAHFFAAWTSTGTTGGTTDSGGNHQHSPGTTQSGGNSATSSAATSSSWRPLHRDMIIAVAN